MPDLCKTIKAMECCLDRNYFSKCPAACPYNGTEQDGACGRVVLNDALELLKAQTVDAVPPEKHELPFGMYDAVKYEYKCGACGCGLMRNEKWMANYCPECGRAVEWDV